MSSNLVLQAYTARSFRLVKISSLKKEVVRRLKHTSMRLEHTKRMDELEDLSQRIINSGHKPSFISGIHFGGILRFEAKLKLYKLPHDAPGYNSLHQPLIRNTKMMRIEAMSKADWYKDKDKEKSESSKIKEKNIDTTKA